jgi:hypothetical protein
MRRVIVIVWTAACVLDIAGVAAVAQVLPPLPDLRDRMPLPMAPIVNGPLTRTPPPQVVTPAPLDTFSDRTTQCLELGIGGGLSGSDLDSHVGACANEN